MTITDQSKIINSIKTIESKAKSSLQKKNSTLNKLKENRTTKYMSITDLAEHQSSQILKSSQIKGNYIKGMHH